MPFHLPEIGLDPKNPADVQKFLGDMNLQTKLANGIIQRNMDYVKEKWPTATPTEQTERAVAMYYG